MSGSLSCQDFTDILPSTLIEYWLEIGCHGNCTVHVWVNFKNVWVDYEDKNTGLLYVHFECIDIILSKNYQLQELHTYTD